MVDTEDAVGVFEALGFPVSQDVLQAIDSHQEPTISYEGMSDTFLLLHMADLISNLLLSLSLSLSPFPLFKSSSRRWATCFSLKASRMVPCSLTPWSAAIFIAISDLVTPPLADLSPLLFPQNLVIDDTIESGEGEDDAPDDPSLRGINSLITMILEQSQNALHGMPGSPSAPIKLSDLGDLDALIGDVEIDETEEAIHAELGRRDTTMELLQKKHEEETTRLLHERNSLVSSLAKLDQEVCEAYSVWDDVESPSIHLLLSVDWTPCKWSYCRGHPEGGGECLPGEES